MALVENGLARLIIEGMFDVPKFGKVITFEIAQYRLRAEHAGIAILGETGLSFLDWPIIIRPSRHPEIRAPLRFGLYRNLLQLRLSGWGADPPDHLKTAHTNELAMGDAGAIGAAAHIAYPCGLSRAMGLGIEFSPALAVTPQHTQELGQTLDRSLINRQLDVRKIGCRPDQSRSRSHQCPILALDPRSPDVNQEC